MFRLMKSGVLAAALAFAPVSAVLAQSPDTVLRDLIDGKIVADDFAPAFLTSVSIEQVQSVIGQVRDLIGEPLVVDVQDGSFYIETLTHRASGTIKLDDQDRVISLWFAAPEPIPQDMDTALGQLAGLSDQVSWLVMRDGQVLQEHNADMPMAVASAFKIGVMSVLMQDIKAGERDWDDVITLEARHKSLPTGQLQTLPDGAPVTLHTAAALMISISDNTATDLLMDLVGRDRVSAALGIDNALTTREFFALKLNEEAQAEWLLAAPEDRPALAASAAQTLPQVGTVPPYVPGLEWDIPLSRLCALMTPLADLPVMQINPGIADPANWARVAYKGGSEPGVANFTTALLDDVGREVCVAVTFNGKQPIDMLAAAAAYKGVLAVLR
ncbi:serine hydrolase [Pacificoceanicola onchidii]|uniref:serine hydrolase n=1 Tax=Pacificoceanicola onchidii TaxID=2562685 RepID=UPI001455F136|nr:serine hydrolase [Pacificoceanicola onchidii]